MAADAHRVEGRHVTKIFGDEPAQALTMMERGASREEILKATGHVLGVHNVSFEVGPSETFVVMGLSGSGKSTLVRCVNRLIEPTAGEILIDGEDILKADSESLRQMRLHKFGMVFQHFALFPHKSVCENVEYGLKAQGMAPAERRERAMHWLETVGLGAWADNPPDSLSGGMKQRVGLARALAVEPTVLIMDEPFSALDPLIRRDMQDELIEMQKSMHKSIMFITHDLHEALKLGDRVAIMKEGRFVQVGTPEKIVGEPADPYVTAFTQDVDRSRVVGVSSIMTEDKGLPIEKSKVETIVQWLHELGTTGVYMVREDGRPAGLLKASDIEAAKRESVSDLRPKLCSDFPKVSENALIMDLYPLAEKGLPIAVLDSDNRLRGVVNPLDIFNELAASSEVHAGGAGAKSAAAGTGQAA